MHIIHIILVVFLPLGTSLTQGACVPIMHNEQGDLLLVKVESAAFKKLPIQIRNFITIPDQFRRIYKIYLKVIN